MKVLLFFILSFLNINLLAGKMVITGVVLNGETHNPINDVIVTVVELNISTTSNEKGIFTLNDLSAGEYILKFNRLGYKEHQENLSVHSDHDNSLIVHLYPISIQSSTIIITGEHPTSRFNELNEAFNVLKGKDLQRDMSMTLASTLKNELGISLRSMGPAPARPVIRGLGGDRIVISEDGNNINDLSATSPDHAVTLETFTSERIEVLRGPGVLSKTSSTLGGVVNVIRNEIPNTMLTRISGSAGMYGETANKGYLGALSLNIPLRPFVLKGEVSGKKTGNQHTPIGELKNSHIEGYNYSVGAGFIRDWILIGASIREYDSEYGIPGGFVGAHPNGVDIHQKKKNYTGKIFIPFEHHIINNIDINLIRTYYRHIEYESSGTIGAEFSIYDYAADINLNYNKLFFSNNGRLGLSFKQKDFKIGGFVFTPQSEALNLSAHLYENLILGDFDVQYAFRYSYDAVTPIREYQAKIGYIRKREFQNLSFSGSLLYHFWDFNSVGFTVSRSTRVPTIEELFSEGPHLAAYSYETGNPELKSEKGIGLELFTFFKNDDFFAMLTLFRNDMSYYILPRNTGNINFSTLLPIYSSFGEKVLMQGVEGEVNSTFNKFSFRLSASYTQGEFKSSKQPMPLIPPLKGTAEVRYLLDDFNVGLEVEMASRQNRVDIFEESTAGYSILNGYAQYVLSTGSLIHNITFNAENIFNKEYRNHLSRVKSIMPETGRNFKLIYRLYF